MRAGNLLQFFSGLRQSHVDDAFALLDPFQQKLQRERCFAGSRVAFDQVEVSLRQPAAKNVVQTRDAGQDAARAVAGRDYRLRSDGGSVPLVSVHSSPQTRIV